MLLIQKRLCCYGTTQFTSIESAQIEFEMCKYDNDDTQSDGAQRKKKYLNIKTKTHEVQHQTRDKTMFRMSSTEATITIGELEGIRRVLAHQTHGK